MQLRWKILRDPTALRPHECTARKGHARWHIPHLSHALRPVRRHQRRSALGSGTTGFRSRDSTADVWRILAEHRHADEGRSHGIHSYIYDETGIWLGPDCIVNVRFLHVTIDIILLLISPRYNFFCFQNIFSLLQAVLL